MLVITQSLRTGSSLPGIIIPIVVFLISFIVTWILYKYFSKRV